jgi:hypothetical protein
LFVCKSYISPNVFFAMFNFNKIDFCEYTLLGEELPPMTTKKPVALVSFNSIHSTQCRLTEGCLTQEYVQYRIWKHLGSIARPLKKSAALRLAALRFNVFLDTVLQLGRGRGGGGRGVGISKFVLASPKVGLLGQCSWSL